MLIWIYDLEMSSEGKNCKVKSEKFTVEKIRNDNEKSQDNDWRLIKEN